MNKPSSIIIHCSDLPESIFDQFGGINRYHRDERLFPISSLGIHVGYHRLVTGDKVYLCRQDNEEGAHCNQTLNGVSMNFQSLGICWGGDGDIELPSKTHYQLLQKTIWGWQDKYNIPNTSVYFHRSFAHDKTCPGSQLTNEWLAALLTRPVKQEKPDSQRKKKEATIAAHKKEISRLQAIVASLLESLGFK